MIELLVAVGIIAILAGVAVPVVISFVGSSEDKAQKAEFANVQTAVDALMADHYASTLPALALRPVAAPKPCVAVGGLGTNDMAAFPCGVAPAHALYPDYIRVDGGLTSCDYAVADDGTVSQVVGSCP